MAIIYKIENKLNHKKYIGQSKLTLEWRLTNKWCGHFVAAENGYKSKLCNALRKYGKDNFTYEIIEERDTSEFSSKELMQQWLNEREIYWIAYYDTQHSGYNQTKGGEYKPSLTLKGKEAQRKAVLATYATGEPQKKISKAVKLAHKLHPEIIEKIRNKSQSSCWVYKIENGIEERHFIWASQLEDYLNKGYTKGISPSQKESFCYNQKGKSRTDEERSKISKALTGKKKTSEHAKHISEGLTGLKRTEETKRNVSIGTKKAMANLSEEKKRQMKEKSSAALKGRKRVTNGKEERYVKGEELDKLLAQGWHYGTGKIYVTNEKENKTIYSYELEEYLNKGYRRGLKKRENKEN